MGNKTSAYTFLLGVVNTLATCNLLEAFFADTQTVTQTVTDTDAKAYFFTSAKYV